MATSAAQEIKYAAQANALLAGILRRRPKSAIKAVALPQLVGVNEVVDLFQLQDIKAAFKLVQKGRLPPPIRVSDTPLWPVSLIRALALGTLPAETRQFKGPAEWEAWLCAHYNEEFHHD